MTESEIQKRIMLEIGGRADCRCFRMNVALATDTRTGQRIRFGLPGMADLLVLVAARPFATFVWVEVKSATGTLRPAQRHFRDMVHRIFGPAHYIVARSVEDAVRAVDLLLGRG